MKRDKKSLVAYLAGLMDGEGCIHCSFIGNTRPRILLQIWMTTHQWVDIAVGLFGGTVRLTVNEKQGRPAYIWILGNNTGVKKALKTMLPFLRVKREQAELAIRLIDRKIVGNRKRLKQGIKGKHGGTAPLSDHEIQKRHELSDKLKQLKEFQLGFPKCVLKEEHNRIRAAVENKRFDNEKLSSRLRLCSDPGERQHRAIGLDS